MTTSSEIYTTTLIVIIPAIFVLLLGYSAGRAKKFDADQVKGINELVLDFALPASLFVGIAGIKHAYLTEYLTESLSFFLTILMVFSIFYLLALVIGKFLLHLNSNSAALFALGSSFPSVSFFGPSILGGMFGVSDAAIAITSGAIIGNLIIVPISVLILENSRIRESGTSGSGFTYTTTTTNPKGRKVIIQALVCTGKAPYVWAPVVGLVLVLVGVPLPSLLQSMFSLIGQAASGVALFVAGLLLAAHKVKLNKVVLTNAALKSFGEPSLMLFLVLMFGLTHLLTAEAIMTVALPAGTIATILAGRYRVYESGAASNLILTSFLMIGVLPLFQYFDNML
jgi:malonate transporter and related proteins